jgi:hypothetical protein
MEYVPEAQLMQFSSASLREPSAYLPARQSMQSVTSALAVVFA